MEQRKRHMAAVPESMRRMSLDNSALDTAHMRRRVPLFTADYAVSGQGGGEVGGNGGVGGGQGVVRGVATIVEEGQQEGVFCGWWGCLVMCVYKVIVAIGYGDCLFLHVLCIYYVGVANHSHHHSHHHSHTATTNNNQHRVYSAPPSSAGARSSEEGPSPGQTRPPRGPAAPSTPMRVLIAEDNRVNQMVICKVLQRVIPETTPDVVNNGKEVCGGDGRGGWVCR